MSEATANPTVSRLMATVVEGGYCIGCGVCAAVPDSPLKMTWTPSGKLAPVVSEAHQAKQHLDASSVCPFSDKSLNEDELADELFDNSLPKGEFVGRYQSCWAGHVAEPEFRLQGSSGGFGTWLPLELLRAGLVDGVVHVHNAPAGADGMFRYAVSRSPEELLNRAKSAYYPIEMSAVIKEIREIPGRYALVGLPCFIKGVRLLARQDEVLKSRIRFCISLVCGHLKSSRYADFLAWQAGVAPGTLTHVDFRVKTPGRASNVYSNAFEGLDANGNAIRRVTQSHEVWGASWAYALFMYEACNYCDDVVGETADVSIGDAWLRPFVEDWRGSNLLVVRNSEIGSLIAAASAESRLVLSPIEDGDVGAAQAGCYRQRREGLAYRLFLRDSAGDWRPRKRIAAASSHLRARLRRKYALRAQFPRLSDAVFTDAVAQGSFDVFKRGMLPMMNKYDRSDRPWARRFASGIKQRLLRLLRLRSQYKR